MCDLVKEKRVKNLMGGAVLGMKKDSSWYMCGFSRIRRRLQNFMSWFIARGIKKRMVISTCWVLGD